MVRAAACSHFLDETPLVPVEIGHSYLHSTASGSKPVLPTLWIEDESPWSRYGGECCFERER